MLKLANQIELIVWKSCSLIVARAPDTTSMNMGHFTVSEGAFKISLQIGSAGTKSLTIHTFENTRPGSMDEARLVFEATWSTGEPLVVLGLAECGWEHRFTTVV